MGCCISIKTSQDSEQKPNPLSSNHHHFANSSTTHIKNHLPPLPPEEETVKEIVLSETPTTKPPDSSSVLEFNKPVVDPKDTDSDPDSVELNHPLPFDLVVEETTEESSEVFSGASDFACESASTTTATKTILRRETEDKYEEEEEVMSKKFEKPVIPAKGFGRREYSGSVTMNRTRSPSKQRNNPRRGNASPTGFRPVSGVRGGRGSRSPAMHRGERSSSNVVARSLSMRGRTGVVDGAGRLKSPADKKCRRVGEQNDSVLASESFSESFENPLVTLECFVFL